MHDDDHQGYAHLKVRLYITVVCNSLSVIGACFLVIAYRRYANQVRNPYNNLYVNGVGVLQGLQSVQKLFFAVLHLVQLGQFSGPLCIVNAVLDQLLDSASQVFVLGFFFSLLTMRISFRCNCCGEVVTAASYSTYVVSVQKKGTVDTLRNSDSKVANEGSHREVTSAPHTSEPVAAATDGSHEELSREGSAMNRQVTDATVISSNNSNNELQQPQETGLSVNTMRTVNSEDVNVYPTRLPNTSLARGATDPLLLHSPRAQLLSSNAPKRYHISAREEVPHEGCLHVEHVSMLIWPTVAVILSIGSTVLMYLTVVSDPNASPDAIRPHDDDLRTNFDVSLGWCWIPNGFDKLRFVCCYVFSAVNCLSAVASFAMLWFYEYGCSLSMHSAIYIRIGCLCVYVLVSYLVGAIVAFAPKGAIAEGSEYASTALFSLYGLAVAVIFVATEKMFYALIDGSDVLPGNGFSASINHLLLLEVSGVAQASYVDNIAYTQGDLQTPSQSQRYFFEGGTGGWSSGYIDSARKIASQREGLVFHDGEYGGTESEYNRQQEGTTRVSNATIGGGDPFDNLPSTERFLADGERLYHSFSPQTVDRNITSRR